MAQTLLQPVQPRDRLHGGLPKVGIRPTIDGRRRGVRESLEDKTMEMAQAAARLISEQVRHSCGLPVECVLADTTIGGVAEAMACQEKFEREGVQITLTVTPCWCYGTETMDMSPTTIKGVWGFNGTERPGAVFLAAVKAAHNQKGLPAFCIYGRDVQDLSDNDIPQDVQDKLVLFVKAAVAAATLRGKSYLSVGSMCMGIAGSVVSQEFFQEYLGMRCESVDSVELLRRIHKGIYDPEEFERALAWAKANCHEGFEKNPQPFSRQEKDEQWAFIVKCALIVRDLMVGNPHLAELGFEEEANGHNAIAGGFQGQRQWTDYLPNGDFLEAILNSSFDWAGIREPYIVATENDSLNGVGMLFGHLLTDQAMAFADVRTYWSPEAVERVTSKRLTGLAEHGIIHLINSGAVCLDTNGAARDATGKPCMKPWWALEGEDAAACLAATDWCAADQGYFRGGGFSCHFPKGTEGGMPLTMVRINRIAGLGPVLQIAEGWSCELDPDIYKALDSRTDPTWPTTWFAPRLTGQGAFQDVYSVMNAWGANHGAFTYGHCGDKFITLASILRIPVCLHNVPEERIFRPAYWDAFGMDLEGADYRACAALGPQFK